MAIKHRKKEVSPGAQAVVLSFMILEMATSLSDSQASVRIHFLQTKEGPGSQTVSFFSRAALYSLGISKCRKCRVNLSASVVNGTI